MLVLNMIDKDDSVLSVSFSFKFPRLTCRCPEIVFDSFVLRLCIGKHDTDNSFLGCVHNIDRHMQPINISASKPVGNIANGLFVFLCLTLSRRTGDTGLE